MKTFQVEVNVSADRRLQIALPDDVEQGTYQVVVVMNPTAVNAAMTAPGQSLNALAGRVQSFAGVDVVEWQRQIRDEWDDR